MVHSTNQTNWQRKNYLRDTEKSEQKIPSQNPTPSALDGKTATAHHLHHHGFEGVTGSHAPVISCAFTSVGFCY